MSILTDDRLYKLFRHNNVVLVLSLQTPTEKSFIIRGYKRISFEKYMQIAGNSIRAKFESGSRSRIEIHVATELEHMANFHRDRGGTLWSIFDSEREQAAWLQSYIKELQVLDRQLEVDHPEFYARERSRTLTSEAGAFDAGTITCTPDRLLENPAGVPETEYWGWMFAPNCFLRLKRFGLWGMQQPFLEKHLDPGELLFVEERTEPLDCPMAHNLTMLADGTLSLCCLDYEGEMSIGNLESNTLEAALGSAARTEMTKNAMVNQLCRRCQGNGFVFDTGAAQGDVVEPKFGFGWHAYEADLHGAGGRWSKGAGRCYFYATSPVRSIDVAFWAPFPDATEFELVIGDRADGTDAFDEIARLGFKGRKDQLTDVRIPVDLPAGRVYRLEFASPTFVPRELYGTEDDRKLGLAVLSVECRGMAVGHAVREGAQLPAAS